PADCVLRCRRGCSRYRVALAADIELSQTALLPKSSHLLVGSVAFTARSEVGSPALNLPHLLICQATGTRVLLFHFAQDPDCVFLALFRPGQYAIEDFLHLFSRHGSHIADRFGSGMETTDQTGGPIGTAQASPFLHAAYGIFPRPLK